MVSCLFQDQQPATKETPSIFAVFRDFQALPLFIIEIRVWRGKLGSQVSWSKDWCLEVFLSIILIWPPPSNSDHQDSITFSVGNPYKPSFTTATGRGPHPKYNNDSEENKSIYGVTGPNAHITTIWTMADGPFQWLAMTLDVTGGFSTLRWLLGCPFDGSSLRSMRLNQVLYTVKKALKHGIPENEANCEVTWPVTLSQIVMDLGGEICSLSL